MTDMLTVILFVRITMLHLNKQTVFTPLSKNSQNHRDTLNPFIKKEGNKLMKYYDDQGNELNIRTELDDMLDRIYDELDKMTPEERMAWYSRGMYVKPLKYTQEIDNTVYIVRTEFNESSDSTVYDTVERITSKDI